MAETKEEEKPKPSGHTIEVTCDRCYLPFMIIRVICDGKKDAIPITSFREQYQEHLRSKICRSSYQQSALITGATGFESNSS